MRIVLDTNVIIFGLLSKGPPGALFYAIQNGKYELCLTQQILNEVKRVLHYPKILRRLKRAGVILEEVLEWLLTNGKLFSDIEAVRVVAEDPSDDVFINCAIASGAKWIVSGDIHLTKMGNYQGINIVSPAEFMRKSRKSDY